MKQLLNVLPKNLDCFKYLWRRFSHLLEAKLEEGIFVGPDISMLTFDSNFEVTISTKEEDLDIISRCCDYKLIVDNMTNKLKKS